MGGSRRKNLPEGLRQLGATSLVEVLALFLIGVGRSVTVKGVLGSRVALEAEHMQEQAELERLDRMWHACSPGPRRHTWSCMVLDRVDT